jgi:hypothetical protein
MRREGKTRLILLEFNELAPELMDRFIAMDKLPNFKRLRDESQVFATEAAERGWELNPWVQWVTVHSGLNYSEHRIIELDEGHKLAKKRIWDVVSQSGDKVWLCGSMNIGYEQPPNGLVMPDPWTTQVPPSPSLESFFQFVQRNVLEHTTNRPDLSLRDYWRFLSFMLTHGLSLSTVLAIVKQLVAERFDSSLRWKRAVLLDKLQFDVFRWHFERLRPELSTFFCNSTAHFQHYHWREMEPHLFASQPSPEKLAAHDTTILFGYEQMDQLVGHFLGLLGPDTILIFATAISQQPCLIYEDQGGKVMYRPRDMAPLMNFAGVTEQYTATPLMAEVFNVQLTTSEDADRVEKKLLALKMGEKTAVQVQRKGALLNVKCCIHARQGSDASIVHSTSGAEKPFLDLFFELDDVKSGMHHPDGIFWVRTPDKATMKHTSKVPLSSVAPTILRLMGLQPPDHMGPPIAQLVTAETKPKLEPALAP